MGLPSEATNTHLDRYYVTQKEKKDIHHKDGMFSSSQEVLKFKLRFLGGSKVSLLTRSGLPLLSTDLDIEGERLENLEPEIK